MRPPPQIVDPVAIVRRVAANNPARRCRGKGRTPVHPEATTTLRSRQTVPAEWDGGGASHRRSAPGIQPFTYRRRPPAHPVSPWRTRSGRKNLCGEVERKFPDVARPVFHGVGVVVPCLVAICWPSSTGRRWSDSVPVPVCRMICDNMLAMALANSAEHLRWRSRRGR